MKTGIETEKSTTPVLLAEDRVDEETTLRREQATLAEQISARKEELARIETEWAAFRARYMETVGKRYAELEEVERQIAEFQTARGLSEELPEEKAEEVEDDTRRDEAHTDESGFQPLKQMRKLFRRVAKMFHPDLAGDDGERQRRHTLMTEANQAYREGDAERLTSLLEDEQTTPETESADDESRPRRAALRAHVARLRRELHAIETDIKRITDTDFYYFKTKAEEVAVHGRDLLADMEARVAEQVVNARRRFEVMSVEAGEN